MRRIGVLALQQLAFGQRRAGIGQGTQLGVVAIARELGKRAREQQVACRDRELAARCRSDRRATPAQLGPVDHIVVHERCRVDELDRHGRAHEALLSLEIVGACP